MLTQSGLDLIRPPVTSLPYSSLASHHNNLSPTRSLFSQGPSTYVPGPIGSPNSSGYTLSHGRYSAASARVKQLRTSSDPLTLEVCTISYTVECQLGKGRRSSVIFVRNIIKCFFLSLLKSQVFVGFIGDTS